ncbi:MAG: type II toxin-antitoxin system MqsA family antitoxin, partial [Deltaproteobacteria bacterium]|nr:type II toxin-antitoxin system MqsA family antitoxin [Deltaproteobacteria bacterium]
NLGLTQVELAKNLGVGEKNFARYENGQATQGRAMDTLLKVLKNYPAMIKTLAHSQTEENISTEVSFTISVMKKKRSSKAVKVSSSGDFNFKEGFCNAAGF